MLTVSNWQKSSVVVTVINRKYQLSTTVYICFWVRFFELVLGGSDTYMYSIAQWLRVVDTASCNSRYIPLYDELVTSKRMHRVSERLWRIVLE